MRLDKYLKVSRLIKRRTVANEACDNERVSVNGRGQRASYDVKGAAGGGAQRAGKRRQGRRRRHVPGDLAGQTVIMERDFPYTEKNGVWEVCFYGI